MYEYKATLIRVVDGDTVWMRVDLGFRMFAELDFRLYGIDAPERVGIKADPAKAALSKEYIEQLLAPIAGRPQILKIQTFKPDKYGRWLVEIWTEDGRNINDLMVESGHATEYPI